MVSFESLTVQKGEGPKCPNSLDTRRKSRGHIDQPPHGCGSKPNGIPFWGMCTTHFRIYFSGDWDVRWGYNLDFDPWPHVKHQPPEVLITPATLCTVPASCDVFTSGRSYYARAPGESARGAFSCDRTILGGLRRGTVKGHNPKVGDTHTNPLQSGL